MNYLKMLGLLTVAMAALTAFAGTATATFTSPAGTAYAGGMWATSTNSGFDGVVDITCQHSQINTTPISSGYTDQSVWTLTFTNCSRSVTVTASGTMSIASDGTVSSTGARITVQTTILGFPVHCMYFTGLTKIGTLTEGVAPARMHIGSAPMVQQTSSLCGDDGEWTGTYTVTNPKTAITVD